MSSPKFFHAVGLDAGSLRTRCVICRLEEGEMRFLGYGTAASNGWAKGLITDYNDVSESIEAALGEAEAAAQVSVEGGVVGLGGAVRGANCRGFHDLGRVRAIEQRDVNAAVARACRVVLPEDIMILHKAVQDFIVDGHPGHRDPRQMMAGQMEANVHLVMTPRHQHDWLVNAVNRAHLAVEETVFEALAACYAAVLPDDRRTGVALLVIGAQTSELIAYYGDALQLAVSMPIGGDHFTRDLAQGLCITFEDAEIVKREFGNARADATAENCSVELPSRTDRDVSRRTLNCILESRALDLFQLVERELARVGMDGALTGGVFLAGGGACLEGLWELGESVLKRRVVNALPVGIRDWPDEICDPSWTTAAGLAMYAAKLKSLREIQKQSFGVLGRILK